MAGAALVASLALAQPSPAPKTQQTAQARQEPPRNLRVLPKDMPREQVIQVMQRFTRALGVQCGFCHKGRDFASEANPHKEAARGMMRMTSRINGELLPAIPALHDPVVTCYTCHRGSPRPAAVPPAPAPASGKPSAPPAHLAPDPPHKPH